MEPVPTVLEVPIKSLGCQSDVNLNNTQAQQIREDIITGLGHVNSTALIGKKGQQTKLEAPELANYVVRSRPFTGQQARVFDQLTYEKLLGLPRYVIRIGLYGNRVLSLPITTFIEEYKNDKVRLDMIPKQYCSIPSNERKCNPPSTDAKPPCGIGIMQARYNMEERPLGKEQASPPCKMPTHHGEGVSPIKKSRIAKSISQTKQDSQKKITTFEDLWKMERQNEFSDMCYR